MTLDGPIRDLDSALSELHRAASDSDAWDDQERRRFDADRLTPLANAGRRLASTLTRAQQKLRTAEALLSDR